MKISSGASRAAGPPGSGRPELPPAEARAEGAAAAPAVLRRRALHLLRLVLVAAGYVVLAKGGLALASINPSATPIWPPTGFALAAVLLWGRGIWPAIFAAAVLTNATTAGTLYTATAIAAGNCVEALLAAWLIERYSQGRATFETPGGVARFALIAASSGTVVSATVGVATLALAGAARGDELAAIWATWWLGNTAGALVITPVIVLWAVPCAASSRGGLLHAGALYAAAAVIGLCAFSPLFGSAIAQGPLAFLAILPLMGAAFRSQRHTATVALILCILALWGVLAGGGPFAAGALNQTLLLLVTFMVSATVPALALAAAVAVRRGAEERQGLLMAELDHRVRNILATIQATSRLTARSAPNKDAYAHALEGRIAAMARTHGLLSRRQWKGARLTELLDDELAAHAGARSCFATNVPACILPPRQALNLALIVHELATNAAKYGALSQRGGLVSIDGVLEHTGDGRVLRLEWRESGGPAVAPPVTRGFGTQLIERAGAQDNMRVAIDFAPPGVCCRIALPLGR